VPRGRDLTEVVGPRDRLDRRGSPPRSRYPHERGPSGGRGGMSRIGKIRNGLSLSYRFVLPRQAAAAAGPPEVHGHGADPSSIVWPGHLREQRVEGSRGRN